jgi:hypothetical protein
MQRAVADEAPTEGIGTMADAPRVFLSYSHDSDEHADRVLALADALCDRGIDVILDRYVHPAPAEGWPRWMDRNLDEAQFVLMVCTETYRRRVMGLEEPGKGLGVRWEGGLIYNRIYHDKPSGSRFIPILLPGSEPSNIPNPVQGHAYHQIATFDLIDPGFEALYRHLTDQPATPRPGLGPIQTLPRKPRPRAIPAPLSPSGGPPEKFEVEVKQPRNNPEVVSDRRKIYERLRGVLRDITGDARATREQIAELNSILHDSEFCFPDQITEGLRVLKDHVVQLYSLGRHIVDPMRNEVSEAKWHDIVKKEDAAIKAVVQYEKQLVETYKPHLTL